MPGSRSRGSSLHIGFVSTRFRGLDGVSLEAMKWARVLEELDHKCFWFAGELDGGRKPGVLVPEAFFGHPSTVKLNNALFGARTRSRGTTNELHRRKNFLKDKLYGFLDKFRIDLLIPENALSIPMHLPLGMAITEVIAETGMPTIAHHHDFFWERTRFLDNACGEILDMAFPPNLPSMEHVVINSIARVELAARRGIAASLIPNVMDFEARTLPARDAGRGIRDRLGFARDDVLILQPTRVVQRKGIEHAIHLVRLLDMPNARLIVSHASSDEGSAYAEWLVELARIQGVPLLLVHDRLAQRGRSLLPDLYAAADFVTFPSVYEGFGNAFLEAVYYGKPLLVNRYPVFEADIGPKGFDVVEIDGYVTGEAVRNVRELLADGKRRGEAARKNLDIARRHYSLKVLRRELEAIVARIARTGPWA